MDDPLAYLEELTVNNSISFNKPLVYLEELTVNNSLVTSLS